MCPGLMSRGGEGVGAQVSCPEEERGYVPRSDVWGREKREYVPRSHVCRGERGSLPHDLSHDTCTPPDGQTPVTTLPSRHIVCGR